MEDNKVETESLLANLSVGLSKINLKDDIPTPKWNTLNPYFGVEDITDIVDWPEFNYNTIIERYGDLLNTKQIEITDFSLSRMHTDIWHKSQLDSRLDELLRFHLMFALQAAFKELEPQLKQLNLTPVTFGQGTMARTIGLFWPDASFPVSGSRGRSENRAP